MLGIQTGFWALRPTVVNNSFTFKIYASSFTIPSYSGGNYNYLVDWGDGNSNTVTAWNSSGRSHTYAGTAEYIITITGTFHGIQFANGTEKSKIIEILNWGNMRIGSSGQAFRGCNNLIITATDFPDTSMETSFDSMFRDCKEITTIPNFSSWDVSNVVYMGSLASGSTKFNADCSGWNTPSLLKLGNTFYNSGFNRNIGGWNISGVDNFTQCFHFSGMGDEAYSLTLAGWGVQSPITSATINVNAHYYTGGAAETGRTNLINNYGWVFNDNGGVPPP